MSEPEVQIDYCTTAVFLKALEDWRRKNPFKPLRRRRSDHFLEPPPDRLTSPDIAVSRLLYDLRHMGYQWARGSFTTISEHGVVYRGWRNGDVIERGSAPFGPSFDYIVDEALAMFQRAWNDGNRFIVWRVLPEIMVTKPPGPFRENHKLYFRWHFLRDIPTNYNHAA